MKQMKHIMVRDIPQSERPRERMLKYGAENMSSVELLAILLRTGNSKESVLQVAQNLLVQTETLKNLNETSLEELMKIRGIGLAKAIQIKAGIELGRRVVKQAPEEKFIIRKPEDAAKFIMEDIAFLKKEHFITLLLDTKNHIISKETISIGTLNASIVHPREVFKPAIKKSVSAIILVHNHPSGDTTPSNEDIKVTRRLIKAGEILGIDVLDHIIIGGSEHLSFKVEGYM